MGLELADGPDCGLSEDERPVTRYEMLAEGMTDDILFTPQRFRFMAKANRNNRLSIDALESTGLRLAHTDTRDRDRFDRLVPRQPLAAVVAYS